MSTAADLAAIRKALQDVLDCDAYDLNGEHHASGDYAMVRALEKLPAALAALARVEADTLTPEEAWLLRDLIDAAEGALQEATDEEGVKWFAINPAGQKRLYEVVQLLGGMAMVAKLERIAGDTGEAT